MKKTLLLIAVVALFAATPALADTVRFEWAGDVNVSGQTLVASATAGTAFHPTTNEIAVEVSGKTCKLVSSKQAIGSKGCNYTIIVGADGSVTAEARDSNSGCTQKQACQ